MPGSALPGDLALAHAFQQSSSEVTEYSFSGHGVSASSPHFSLQHSVCNEGTRVSAMVTSGCCKYTNPTLGEALPPIILYW